MTLSKKRTINEYRQTKDSVYRHPVSHNEISDTNKTIDNIEIDEDNINNKHKDINMNEFMLYLRNRIDTMKRQDILPEVITSSLLVLKNNPRISLYEAIEAGCEEWNL